MMHEFIQERDARQRAIDAEFEAMPVSKTERTFYHWQRREWVTAPLLDLGAKRKQRPRQELAGMPTKKRNANRERGAKQADKAEAWMIANGPASVNEISAGSGVPVGTVRNAVKFLIPCSRTKRTPKSGSGVEFVYKIEESTGDNEQ